jgi:hypothetical protein
MITRKNSVPDDIYGDIAGIPDERAEPIPRKRRKSRPRTSRGVSRGVSGASGVCARCQRPLRSARSIAIGMGPVCAKRDS